MHTSHLMDALNNLILLNESAFSRFSTSKLKCFMYEDKGYNYLYCKFYCHYMLHCENIWHTKIFYFDTTLATLWNGQSRVRFETELHAGLASPSAVTSLSFVQISWNESQHWAWAWHCTPGAESSLWFRHENEIWGTFTLWIHQHETKLATVSIFD